MSACTPTPADRLPWESRCLVARVRHLALKAQVVAGGRPQAWQLERVLEPILGDLPAELAALVATGLVGPPPPPWGARAVAARKRKRGKHKDTP